MGRHRHVVNVRADGIAVVLGPLLRDARITAAALVDVDSGMVLDAWSAAGPADGAPDLELIGAQHAEVVRCALALLRAWHPADGAPGPGPDVAGDGTCEIVLGADDGCRHLLRTVPDPHGDRLALAVVVDGSSRVLDRVRKRLRSVSVDALTAGPSMNWRPVRDGGPATPPVPVPPLAETRAEGGPVGTRVALPAPRDRRPAPARPAPVPARPPVPATPAPAPAPPPRVVAPPPVGRSGAVTTTPRPPSPPAALPAPAPPRTPPRPRG